MNKTAISELFLLIRIIIIIFHSLRCLLLFWGQAVVMPHAVIPCDNTL